MLGPALSHLLNTLNSRAVDPDNKLTEFEAALRAELDAAQQLAPPVRKVLELTREYKVGTLIPGGAASATPGGELASTLHDFSRIGASLESNVALTQIGLGGWGGGDRMQVACDNNKCPNKVYGK